MIKGAIVALLSILSNEQLADRIVCRETIQCGNAIRALAFSEDSAQLYIGVDPVSVVRLPASVLVWDRGKSRIVGTYGGNMIGSAIAVTSDGRVACGGHDGSLTVWSANNHSYFDERAPFGSAIPLFWSADETALIRPRFAKGIEFIDTLEKRQSYEVVISEAVTFTHDASRRRLIIATPSGLLSHDYFSGATKWIWRGALAGVKRVAMSFDGRHLAVGYTIGEVESDKHSGEVGWWNIEEGIEVARFKAHDGNVTGIGNVCKGRFLVTAGDDSVVRLWDLSTFKNVQELIFDCGAGDKSIAMAISTSGDEIAIGCDNGTAQIYSIGQ